MIDEKLTRALPGNYALGFLEGDLFNVFYVGRSDSDLRQRLHQWVGMPSRDRNYLPLAKASWGIRHRRRIPFAAPALDRVGCTESRYTHFAYSYARSADEAYAKEWRNYDAFGGNRKLDNENRPISANEGAVPVRPRADAAPRGPEIAPGSTHPEGFSQAQ
ncbi:MAG: hypothetical protein P8170_22350 [Gemmatimonadota bacterium]